ncbi:MAG: YqhA family protein [Dehalogenimonas sp.]|uniref:YqhA family protein n=1 Tax=Candidatus Dehalogenimonas loeffleri TaxID=3127115 RepID=A0ABZ2JBC4_9CHLR|nr:YqhA family protein [Dehalogenimonas sp.]
MIKAVLEKSKYITLVAVFSLLAASLVAFILGLIQSVRILIDLFANFGINGTDIIPLIEIMDIFLIATVLLIFAFGLYELFIGDLKLPEWLIIKNLHDLKTKLSSIVIMVMAIIFLKHLVLWEDPQGTLFFGLAVAVVAATLIAFNQTGDKKN